MSIMGKTATEVAKDCGCSVATISRWITQLQIGRKYGSSYVLTDAEVKKIQKHRKPTRGRPKKVS